MSGGDPNRHETSAWPFLTVPQIKQGKDTQRGHQDVNFFLEVSQMAEKCH